MKTAKSVGEPYGWNLGLEELRRNQRILAKDWQTRELNLHLDVLKVVD